MFNAVDLQKSLLFYKAVGKAQPLVRRLHKLFENDCNGKLTEEVFKTRVVRLVNEIDVIFYTLGLSIYVQSDPRGLPIYVYHPSDLVIEINGQKIFQDIESCYANIGFPIPIK